MIVEVILSSVVLRSKPVLPLPAPPLLIFLPLYAVGSVPSGEHWLNEGLGNDSVAFYFLFPSLFEIFKEKSQIHVAS